MRFTLLFALIFLFLGLAPAGLSAASLSFSPSSLELIGLDIKRVDVILNSETELLNTVSGTIVLPESCLNIVEITTGKSVIDIWTRIPKELSDVREIPFSGLIVHGLSGQEGHLFTLYLQCSDDARGEALQVQFKNLDFYAKDGERLNEGEQEQVYLVNHVLSENDYQPERPREQDQVAPSQFTIDRVSSPLLFEGTPGIVFVTNDDFSGIDEYELLVSSVRVPIDDYLLRRPDWVPVSSPYRLNDGEQEKFLYVKASDQAGNIIVQESVPTQADVEKKHQKQFMLLILMLSLVVIISLAERYVFRKYRFID